MYVRELKSESILDIIAIDDSMLPKIYLFVQVMLLLFVGAFYKYL